MRKVLWGVALAVAIGGCGHDHEHEEPSLGEDACEHLAESGEALTAGADAAAAPDAGVEHRRYDVTLLDLPGGGHGGHLSFAIGDAADHVLMFTQDVNVVVTDAGGTAVATTKATSVDGCDQVAAVITVPFQVGTYDISITAVDANADEVSFVLLTTGEHEHGENEH